MFDIENELIALGAKNERPDETLRERTLDKLREERQGKRRLPVLRWTAACIAAAMLAAAVLLTVLPGAQQTSFFTIDINPSIGIETDADGVILSVKAQNSDAESLLAGLDLIGMPFIDALRGVVQAAEQQGYLKDNGHVLVAHFGVTAQVTEEEIETAVTESIHKQVNVLLLESGRNDYHDAGQTHQSAGISLLMKNAQRLGIEDADIETIIEAVRKNNPSNGKSPQNSKSAVPAPAEVTEPTDSPGNGNENKPEKSNNGNSGSTHGNSGDYHSGSNGQPDKEDKADKEDSAGQRG
jgi:cytochrome b561